MKIEMIFVAVLISISLAACGQPLSSTSPDKYILLESQHGAILHELGYDKADFGKAYLLVNFSIENHGYGEFPIDPSCFKIVINKVIYNQEYISSMAEEGYPPLDGDVALADGGKISGYLAFLVPDDMTAYAPRYKSYSWDRFNVSWKE